MPVKVVVSEVGIKCHRSGPLYVTAGVDHLPFKYLFLLNDPYFIVKFQIFFDVLACLNFSLKIMHRVSNTVMVLQTVELF